jgi:hypothetical protein
MKRLFALVLAIVFDGRIDYKHHSQHPWIVDFGDPKRYQGCGKTLAAALRHYWTGRPQ